MGVNDHWHKTNGVSVS